LLAQVSAAAGERFDLSFVGLVRLNGLDVGQILVIGRAGEHAPQAPQEQAGHKTD
jgi:hypothetical protein